MMQLIGDTVQIIKTESLQLIREQLAQSAPHLHTVLVNETHLKKKKQNLNINRPTLLGTRSITGITSRI